MVTPSWRTYVLTCFSSSLHAVEHPTKHTSYAKCRLHFSKFRELYIDLVAYLLSNSVQLYLPVLLHQVAHIILGISFTTIPTSVIPEL